MHQLLGSKKLNLCIKFGKKNYLKCYTTGSHFVAKCWYGEDVKLLDADYVNYKTGVVMPIIRDGKFVMENK